MKIKINESQVKSLIKYINENDQVELVTKSIVDELNMNYEPALMTSNDGFDYKHNPIITKKVDGDKLNGRALRDYIGVKYPNVTTKFIEQVIKDWYDGKFKDNNYTLSKSTRFM